MINGEGRLLVNRGRVLLQFLEKYRYCFLELRITAKPNRFRVKVDLDVRRHPNVLDVPRAGRIPKANRRRCHYYTIPQKRPTAEAAHQASPCRLPDQRANPCLSEVPRQRVTSRACVLVNEHHLRTKDRA